MTPRHDIKPNDTQYSNTKTNDTQHTEIERNYANCHIFTLIQNVVKISVVVLTVLAQSHASQATCFSPEVQRTFSGISTLAAYVTVVLTCLPGYYKRPRQFWKSITRLNTTEQITGNILCIA